MDMERQPTSTDTSWASGSTDRLDTAKANFRSAWERFCFSLRPHDIARPARAQAVRGQAVTRAATDVA
jgi:hypothetical protein